MIKNKTIRKEPGIKKQSLSVRFGIYNAVFLAVLFGILLLVNYFLSAHISEQERKDYAFFTSMPFLVILFFALVIYAVFIWFLSKKMIFNPMRQMINSLNKPWVFGPEDSYGTNVPNELGEIAKTIAGYTRDLRDHKACLAQLEKTCENLRHARDAAQISSNAKSEFLSKMSHEIRIPLNSIMGFSELAQDGEISVKTRDYLVKIHESADGLLEVINDILALSKIESGKMKLEKRPFYLQELINRCRSEFISKAAEKGISLHCFADPSLKKRLLGDYAKLRQAVLNLLSNAVKFTNAGKVNLLTQVKSDSGSFKNNANRVIIHFEISDTGIGMTSEQAARIFRPFAQGDISITRKYGGTGLGLVITKNIIELMGGSLKVESIPGTGSNFSFDLAFDTVNEAEEAVVHKMVTEQKRPHFSGEVLICEDSKMNQQVICEHLARVGLKTAVAKNGKEGIDIITERMQKNKNTARQNMPFDLIFMDIHMPVMDGFEATSKIIALGVKTPIVALTANIMINNADHYKKTHGMAGILRKPFKSQELWKCLSNYLTELEVSNIGQSNIGQSKDPLEDAELQMSLKENFVKDNRTTSDDLLKALKEGDVKQAHRIVHTLKSNAGYIGETKLHKAAAAAEEMLKDGKNDLANEQSDLLLAELKTVLDKLVPPMEQEDANKANTHLDPQKIRELLKKLEEMLIHKNPECINMLSSLRGVPGTEDLVRQVEDFEFIGALAALSKLKEDI